MADQAIQRKLLAESNLTLEIATNTALVMETSSCYKGGNVVMDKVQYDEKTGTLLADQKAYD